MRFIHRPALPTPARKYLDKRQAHLFISAADDVDAHWSTSRKAKAMKEVEKTLRRMMFPDERCMYCLDSAGSAIEHFWPKVPYRERTYLWPNLLLACSPCNSKKSASKHAPFPLSSTGEPLLLDPTHDDPWEHLTFLPETATVIPLTEKGRVTWETFFEFNELLERRWRKSWRHLRRTAERHLSAVALDEVELRRELLAVDDHGLLCWCCRDGVPAPFPQLWARVPGLRRQFLQCCQDGSPYPD